MRVLAYEVVFTMVATPLNLGFIWVSGFGFRNRTENREFTTLILELPEH